jgi:copper ion binding protein
MSEAVISVKGMHCNSCVQLIETKLSRLKGIKKVEVNLAEEKAFVQFNPEQITLDTIKEEIIDMGYDVDGGDKQKNTSLLEGVFYGLVPHTGCIAFIIATVLGVTVAIEFFKPLLMNPYFFYILIAISFVFATISSLFYLKKQGFIRFNRSNFEIIISRGTLKRKWKYLSTMYGTTIFINVFLFFFIFPALANIDSEPSTTGSFVATAGSLSSMTLEVAIPCPGHAPLISGELKKISGVQSVKFRFPNLFDVNYDSSTTSKDEILSLDVFNTYKPKIMDGITSQEDTGSYNNDEGSTNAPVGGCGCGRGAGGGCCGCGGG